VSDPDAQSGTTHPGYDPDLATLAERDAFRASLSGSADQAWVNNWIARGCSAGWIHDHPRPQ
jgi:hypothetical protein